MFKNEKGLTLIELLITIAVIAVVAAISVPVVSNVIAASNTNSLNAMQEQVDQFVAEAAESGSVTLNGSTLEARIDQDGDGVDEYLVKTFPVDSKYTVSGTGDGPYTVALGAGASLPTGPVTLSASNLDYTGVYIYFYDVTFADASAELVASLNGLQVGDVITFDTGTKTFNYTWTAGDVAGLGVVSYQTDRWGMKLQGMGTGEMASTLVSITFN